MPEGVVPRCRRRFGRYEVYDEIAAGGMATVHFGRIVGDAGFARIVAVKRLFEHLARQPEFASRFVAEARLAARIHHPNVVATLDTVSGDGELWVVMDYVAGESLAGLLSACAARGERVPVPVAVRVAADALYGLHAAHVAVDEQQRPLGIVHRDASPQNILVGIDGLARVLDFGIAKAANLVHTTQPGQLKGKVRYMAPEQVLDAEVSSRTDTYAISVVLWETLTGERLFDASSQGATMAKVLEGVVVDPRELVPSLPEALGELVVRGLSRDPAQRFPSAHDMAVALESAVAPAMPREVSEWVRGTAADVIARRSNYVRAMEASVTAGACGSPVTAAAGDEEDRHADGSSAPHTLTDVRAGLASEEVPVSGRASSGKPAPRHRARAAVLTAVVLAVVGVAATWTISWRHAPAASPVTDSHEAHAEPSGTTAVVESPAGAEATPSAGASPSVPATSAGRTAPSLARTPAARAPGPASTTRRAAGAVKTCTPPYYEDPGGIRRVKQECL